MKLPVRCTQTNPQRQTSAQGTSLDGGARPWGTQDTTAVPQCPELCLMAVAQ